MISLPDGVVLSAETGHPHRSYVWSGEQSLNVAAAIRSLLKPGCVFLDVGAFSGQHSIRASRLVGESGLVVAFEPDPRVLGRFRRNILESGGPFPNLLIREHAVVHHRSGTAVLHLNEEISMSSLHPDSGETVDSIEVEAVSFLEVLNEFKPDLIKLDIEGAEAAILDTLAGENLDFQPVFIIEDNPGVRDSVHRLGWEFFTTEMLTQGRRKVSNFSHDIIAAPAGTVNLEPFREIFHTNLAALSVAPEFRFV